MHHQSWISGALLTKDERNVLTWTNGFDSGHELRFWNVATGQQIRELNET